MDVSFSELTQLLQEHQQLLGLALSSARMVAWTWDARADRVETTGDLPGIYGVSAVEYAERGFSLIHPDDVARHRGIVDQALATGQPYQSQFRITRPDNGQSIWIEEHTQPLLDEAGQLIKLTGIVMDVTERVQAEGALRAARSELERTFANLDQAVLVLEPSSLTVLAANPAVARIFGYLPQELLGRNIRRLQVSADTHTRFEQALTAALQRHGNFQTETEMRRRNGEVFQAEISASEILDEAGQRRAVVSIVRDISLRRQAEAALIHARQLAERAAERTERLQRVTAALTPALTADEVNAVILAQSLGALGASASAIYLLDREGQSLYLAGSMNYPDEIRARVARLAVADNSPGAFVFRTREPLWLRSAAEFNDRYPELQVNRDVSRNEALTIIPLLLDEHALGVLALSFAQAREFEPEDRDFLVTLAGQCAQALERARLYEAERRARAESEAARRRLAVLAEASASLVGSLDVQATLQTVTQLMLPLLGDYCLIYRIDDNGSIRLAASAHARPEQAGWLAELARLYQPNLSEGRSVLSRVLRTGRPVVVAELPPAPAEPRAGSPALLRVIQNLGTVSVLGVPMIARGRVFGAVMLTMAESGRRYTENDLPLVEELASRAALALDNAGLYETAQQLNADLELRVQARTAELRLSERRLAEAQRLARLGSWHWDIQTNHITWSDELFRIYGLEKGTGGISYDRYIASIHPDERAAVRANVDRTLENHRPFAYDHRIVRPDGSVRVLHAQGQAIEDEQGQLVALSGTGQDITERKRIEEEVNQSREQLRRLSAHLENAREEERARMAREIHDELGGMLTGLKMDVAQLRRALGAPEPRVTEKLDNFSQSIDQTVQTVRRIASELRPSVLDDFGLAAAMEWQLGEFRRRSGLECVWEGSAGSLDLPPEAAIAIYRVFQESLTNIARHAHAKRVAVQVTASAGRLVLRVSDDGRGISPEEALGAKSLGLTGMRERISLLGGQVSVDGRAGQGTTVVVELPLSA
jgi:PAS domain S-box-containing protein